MNLRSGIKKLVSNYNSVIRTIQPKPIKPIEQISTSVTRNEDISNKNNGFKWGILKEDINSFSCNFPMKQTYQSINTFSFCVSVSKMPFPNIKSIIDPDFHKKGEIQVPVNNVGDNSIQLPCTNEQEKVEPTKNIISKKAINIIKIRQKKMRKHKWRKLQKKMKFEFAKIRQKREMRKEFRFQSKLKTILKEGEKFSAEEYLQENLKKLNWKPPVTRARGVLAPQWVIQQELERNEIKKRLKKRIEECLSRTDSAN